MAGKTVDLKFRADLSQLVAEMKGLPGMTEGEAKKMAASLERQIKKSEKASLKAAKATSKAWKSQQRDLKNVGSGIDEASKKLGNLEHAGGETSSVMGGIAGALDLVSPKAGEAARSLGDMSGGIEMVARSGMALAGPLAALTAGVAIGVKIWEHYAEKQRQVQRELEETRRKKIELEAAMTKLDMKTLAAKHEAMLAEGKITQAEMSEWKIRNAAEEENVKVINEANKEQIAARHGLIKSMKAQAVEENLLNQHRDKSTHLAKIQIERLEAATKATDKARKRDAEASNVAITLRSAITAKTDANVKYITRTLDAAKAQKNQRGSAKKLESELQKLLRTTKDLLPKEDLSKYQELSGHLKVLEAASTAAGGKLAEDLAPALGDTRRALADMDAKQAAEELEALVASTEKLAPGATIARTILLTKAQEDLNAAILAGKDSGGQLQARLVDVNQAIIDESAKTKAALEADQAALAKTAEDKATDIRTAYEGAFSNIISGSSMVAAEMLARAEAQATAEVDTAQDSADARQDQLEAERDIRAQLLDEAAERDVSRELAASDAKIALLTTAADAERANLAATKEQQGAAVRDAFMATKALKLTEIAMNTASSVMAMTTAGPAGLLLAGSVVALGATQAAIVAAQEPPSFHLGGIVGSRPDERSITARAGEGVLTRQGVAALGGEGGVAAANRGQGSGPLVVQMVYKHKVLDEVLTDSVRRGGPIGSAINSRSPRGRRNPHGRRAS